MSALFRFLLLLYPSSWRAEYGGEMLAVLTKRHSEVRHPVGFVLFWLETIADLLTNAVAVQAELLRQDVSQGSRTLRRAPAFTLAAVGIAAMGIGATTAAFSMVNHVFLQPFPYTRPDNLVQLRENDLDGMGRYWETSPGNYRDWKAMSSFYQSMGAYRGLSINMSGGQGDPQRLDGASLTAEVLPTLGVPAALGRVFTSADDQESSGRTVILSDGLWHEQFGADPNILGRTIDLDRLPYTIVGVMPKNFFFPDREAKLWTAMRFATQDFVDRRDTYIFPVARLKPGVSLIQAKAALNVIAGRLAHTYPKELARVGIEVMSLHELVSNQTRLTLTVLLAASLCVLLIACVNLAHLLLARALVRRRELAVRVALGAGRERLIRQVMTESIMLAIPGGALGLVLAYAALPYLVRLTPVTLPLAELPALDPTVLLFAVLVTIGTGLSFGIIPALRSSSNSQADLQAGGRSGMGFRQERLRSSLVTVEIACSVVLLVGFGLLMRALWHVQGINPGFSADHVLTLRTQLPMPRYEKVETREPFYQHVLGDTKRIPGVEAVAYTSFLPYAWGGGIWPVEIEGHPETLAKQRTASLRFITPGFFATLHTPFLAGRDFNEFDSAKAAYVAVVSDSFRRRYFAEASALGRFINIGNQRRQIIGIVGDIRNRGPERISEPQVYTPWQQADGVSTWYAPKDLVVRTSGDPMQIAGTLRSIVHAADPAQPISNLRTLTDVVDQQTASRRVELSALGVFASVALLLAATGIHALLAFSVRSRLAEIGVRLALGARPSDVVRATLTKGFELAAVGIVVGSFAAFCAGRLLGSLLAGLKPWDPLVYFVACAVALLMTLLGSILPASRAAKIDPMVALRAD